MADESVDAGDGRPRGRAVASSLRGLRARALQGVTWRRAGMLALFCVVWGLQMSVQAALGAWEDGEFPAWLTGHLGGEILCTVAMVAVMVVPLVGTINLAPETGWRRYALLVLAVAVAAALAAIVRRVFYSLGPLADEPVPLAQWGVWFQRYGQLAALFTVTVEFQRRESRSLARMHGAEMDRMALEREMDEARLQVLQAQIEPHFLFNTLANVRRLYRTDPSAGRAMLQNLMRYLEVALPQMRSSGSTVAREVALAEAYLDVQRVRMGERLAYEVNVPAQVRGIGLPPMMLLTLVENAIKHGIGSLPEGGHVRIAGRVQDDGRLHLSVSDDGRGFHETDGGGTGLANIRARLAALHGAAAALSVADNRPRGVVSTIVLPCSAGGTP